MRQIIRRATVFVLFSALCLCVAIPLQYEAVTPPDPSVYAKDLEQSLNQAERELRRTFAQRDFVDNAIQGTLPFDSLQKYQSKSYSILIYERGQDSLVFWSNNSSIPYFTDLEYSEERSSMPMRIRDSEYQLVKTEYTFRENNRSKQYLLVGLIPIAYRYPIQNSYLSNNFELLPEQYSQFIRISEDSTAFSVNDLNDDLLVYLQLREDFRDNRLMLWAYLFFVLASLCALAAFDGFCIWLSRRRNTWQGIGLFVIGLCIARSVALYFDWPNSASALSIFDPSAFEQGPFRSMGDLIINIFLLLWMVIFVHREWKSRLREYPKWKLHALVLGSHLVLISTIVMLNWVARELVLHSSFFFDVENVTNLSIYSFLGLSGLTFLCMSGFLLAHKMLRQIQALNCSSQLRLFWGIVALALCITLYWTQKGFDSYAVFLFGMAAIYGLLFDNFIREKHTSFLWVSAWLVFFSALSAVILYRSTLEKDLRMRQEYAKKMAIERDVNAERIFERIGREIKEDGFLQLYFGSPFMQRRQAIDRVNYRYLDNNFFGRYDYDVHTYTDLDQPNKDEPVTYAYYNELLKQAEATDIPHLFFYSDIESDFVYIAKYPVIQNARLLGYVLIELRPAQSSTSNVYVELLAHTQDKKAEWFKNYNYALYKAGLRVSSQGGSFPGLLPADYQAVHKETFLRHVEDKEELIVYRAPSDTIAIVSTHAKQPIYLFSLFSYMFCLFMVMVGIMVLIARVGRLLPSAGMIQFRFEPTLRAKLQVSVVLVIIASFVTIAIITLLYFQDEYTEYHKDRLTRKVESASETAHWQILQGGDSSRVLPDVEALAEIHRMDVNLYDTDGALIDASEDAIFDRKLRSRQMDPIAFYYMRDEEQNKFIQDEVIDNFAYLAAYVPLRNAQNQTIAYLNLPYDLANNNLRAQDIADFLAALLNVYVLMLLIASGVALAIANIVTRPLTEIVTQLKRVRLGEKNEPLQWHNDDEIGGLVNRYNQMIEELEDSLEKLARTQRETAWREMAKQVAHEIKNPLTPMKLNIQLLERAMAQDPERAQAMVKRVSTTLIEQIDNLARIASEFSNFAKMPAAENERFELNKLVRSVSELFAEEEDMQFEMHITQNPCWVFADKNQVMRVLNNLVKNAIQAIPTGQTGQIALHLYRHEDWVRLLVRDNGCGIPEDKREAVFVPNFTTKSSGTGLGLAMCKNIVEAANGQIYFSSTVDVGTDFYVDLPTVD